MRLADIAALARENGWQVAENAPLAPLTTFRIGGPAELLVTVPDGAAAAKLLCACRAAGVPFAAAGWANDIPEIEGYMRRNCDYYFKTVATFGNFLEQQ